MQQRTLLYLLLAVVYILIALHFGTAGAVLYLPLMGGYRLTNML